MMPSVTVECELRSFIDDTKYAELLAYFMKEAADLGAEEQETRYFDCPEDLRIQRSSTYAKVWLKKGAMHDGGREEIEVRVPQEDFAKLESLFDALGYRTAIVWHRRRRSFDWAGIEVALDDTCGYGHIIELEKKCAPGEEEGTLALLRARFAEIGIAPTPKEEFDAQLRHYKEHWRELLGAENVTA